MQMLGVCVAQVLSRQAGLFLVSRQGRVMIKVGAQDTYSLF